MLQESAEMRDDEEEIGMFFSRFQSYGKIMMLECSVGGSFKGLVTSNVCLLGN